MFTSFLASVIPASNIFVMTISYIISLYMVIILVRLLGQWSGLNFYNPFAQFAIAYTNPIVMPISKIIKPTRAFDWPTTLLYLACVLLKTLLLVLFVGRFPHLSVLAVLWVAESISFLVVFFLWGVIIGVVLSWLLAINPRAFALPYETVSVLIKPVSGLAQRILPPVAGIDISPILSLLALGMLNEGLRVLFLSLIRVLW